MNLDNSNYLINEKLKKEYHQDGQNHTIFGIIMVVVESIFYVIGLIINAFSGFMHSEELSFGILIVNCLFFGIGVSDAFFLLILHKCKKIKVARFLIIYQLLAIYGKEQQGNALNATIHMIKNKNLGKKWK